MADLLAEARDFAQAVALANQKKKCFVCRLTDEERQIVETLSNEGLPASGIAAWLQKRGHKIQEQSVTRHMRQHYTPASE